MADAAPALLVDAVLLDIDDTLVDTRASFRAAIHAVVERWLPHLPDDRREAAALHWAQDPRGHYRRYTRGETTFEAQRRARAEHLHEVFGGPVLDDADWQVPVEALRALALDPNLLGADVAHEPMPLFTGE